MSSEHTSPIDRLRAEWIQNQCGDEVCEEARLSAALLVLRGAKTHREYADKIHKTSAPVLCRTCRHPAHLGLCTHTVGGTVYACACATQTPPDAPAPEGEKGGAS